mgnify:CR=1 FL=1
MNTPVSSAIVPGPVRNWLESLAKGNLGSINVLAADQVALAERFASRIEDRFAGVEYDLSSSGLPLLRGCIAWFTCHNRSRYPEGDHVIFVGEVEHCAVHPKPPLVFHGGGFAQTLPVS